MTPLEDASALDDPVGIEAEAGVQMIVGDDGVRNVAPRPDDPNSHERTATRTRTWDTILAHDVFHRDAITDGWLIHPSHGEDCIDPRRHLLRIQRRFARSSRRSR